MTAELCFLRTLAPAKSFIAEGIAFDQVDAAYAQKNRHRLMERSYPSGPKKNLLKPGTVIVFQTGEGRLGKLKMLGFRSSHDFSFAGAEETAENIRAYRRKQPEIEKYHMEIAWSLLD
jgi:hypothetical protein